MLNIAINMNRPIECVILIQFQIQIQFVTFRRGHLGTPIDAAPVLLSGKPCSTSHFGTPIYTVPVLLSGILCSIGTGDNPSMLGPAVNRQPGFRRGTRRAKQRSKELCLL